MINCPSCGKKIGELESYCNQCGTNLVFKCPICGYRYYYADSSIDELGKIKCPNCFPENSMNVQIKEIENKLKDIKIKIQKIKDLRTLTLKIGEKIESNIVKNQDKVLIYLSEYYAKYVNMKFRKMLETEAGILIAKYNEDKDLISLFDSLVKVLDKNSEAIRGDPYFVATTKTFEEYTNFILMIKTLMKKEIVKNTSIVIDSISPVEDKLSFVDKIEDAIEYGVDLNDLNHSFDRFFAEIELS